MKSKLFLFAGTALLAGCATSEAPLPPVAVADAAPPVVAPPAPKPEIGAFGFDQAGMDTSVQPGNSFYKYANGTWDAKTAIPADKSNYGMFVALDDLSRQRTNTLIQEEQKNPNSRSTRSGPKSPPRKVCG